MRKNYKQIKLNAFLIAGLLLGNLGLEAAGFTSILQQQVGVSGQVVDENNNPLPGVNIVVKGSAKGTTTDAHGKYNIEVADGSTVLLFSFIGYITKEVTVAAQSVINITMDPDVNTLAEIVVIGYGTQKKGSVTGAVSSVDSKGIVQIKAPSVESALQGRVAGVTVTNNGSPGSAPLVRIRGIGSITGSSEPLYVVDGFPTGGLNNIDPNDIESVDVLKDAAAAAIYGSRAANGVVLITTKKGAKSKGVSVEVDSYYGVQTAWKQLDLLKRDDYVQYGTELLNNAGSALPYRFSHMDEPIYTGSDKTYAETETDWQDAVFRSAPISQVQASIALNADKAKIYASVGTFSQDGIMVGTSFKRYNFRFNSDLNISKHIKFGQTMTVGSYKRRNLQESGGRTLLQHVIRGVPYLPVYDPTKLGGYRAADNNDGSDPENPVRIQEMDSNIDNDMKLLGTAYLDISILPFLSYKFTIGGDFSYGRNAVDQPIYNDGFGARTEHILQDNRTNSFSPLYINQLTFDKQIGKHAINVTAVAERQDRRVSDLKTSARQASNLVYSLQAGSSTEITNNDTYETTLLSYLGRLNYEYNGKYLLSASIRRDGFSSFAPGHKWGNFPGFSVGWRISEESFMSAIPSISELKLRASYGSLGANSIGPFDYQSTVSTNTIYPFNNTNVAGSYFNKLPNGELAWETTNMTNVGIDLGLFENKLTLTAEYFMRKVDNLMLEVSPASSMGYSVDFKGNVGKMENSGFELQLGYNKSAGDLTFNLSGNIGVVTNEVTDLYLEGNTIQKGKNGDYSDNEITKTEVGHSVQGFYGWQVDGIFQSQEEVDAANALGDPAVDYQQSGTAAGDIRFKDRNNDGVINDDDKTYIGSYLPDFTYGLNFSANYKNFDLGLFFQGVQGNEIYNGTKVLSQGMTRLFGSGTEVLDAWTPSNTDTDVPRAVNGDPNQNTRTSDRFVEDGSYMRLKSLNIGFSLPKAFLGSVLKGSIQRIRIYASFQNLLTFTKYTGYDPEIGTRLTDGSSNGLIKGIDYGQYPQPRTIMGGIQLGF